MGNTVKDLIKKPSLLFLTCGHRGLFNWMPDEMYLKIAYYIKMGHRLDLDCPKTFNEKLQWLKLYDRNPKYTKMVDKYEAKNYVASLIGDEYIVPTLGVWDQFDEIDFSKLPNQFVLKCTHDSGGLVICRDKSKLDLDAVRRKMNGSLKHNYFWGMREWPYKDIIPRIIAEKYMENKSGVDLIDYKFYCFNGKPKFLYISEGLENHATARISFLTLDWRFAPYERSDFKPFEKLPARPKTFDKMLGICKKLSEKSQFLRVDLYEIDGKLYFSELTFSPCGGLMPFKCKEHDYEIGTLLHLNCKG